MNPDEKAVTDPTADEWNAFVDVDGAWERLQAAIERYGARVAREAYALGRLRAPMSNTTTLREQIEKLKRYRAEGYMHHSDAGQMPDVMMVGHRYGQWLSRNDVLALAALAHVGVAEASQSNSRQINNCVQRVAELPDRTSPDDWPDAMLVTADELRSILTEELGVADAERSASDCDPVVSCPHCGCVNDASVSNREDVIEHLTKGKIPVVVPVWTCHACEQSWTGHRAEAIRDAAVAAFPTPPPSGGTE